MVFISLMYCLAISGTLLTGGLSESKPMAWKAYTGWSAESILTSLVYVYTEPPMGCARKSGVCLPVFRMAMSDSGVCAAGIFEQISRTMSANRANSNKLAI